MWFRLVIGEYFLCLFIYYYYLLLLFMITVVVWLPNYALLRNANEE